MLPIYIVSLKHDIQKRDIIKCKLDNLQIPFEFVDAVYGKELAQDFFDQLNPLGKSLETGASPTPGEVGCTLSHLKVYALMLQRKQRWACVLEDDAILDDRFKDFYTNFPACQSKLRRDGLYLLGGQNGVSANILVARSFFSFVSIGRQRFTKIIKSEAYVCRTCCYLVSNTVAERVIKLSKSVFLLADDWEFLVKHGIINNIFLADFVDHPLDLSLSSIEQERRAVQNKVRATSGKKSIFRRLKNGVFFYAKFYIRVVLAQLYRFKR